MPTNITWWRPCSRFVCHVQDNQGDRVGCSARPSSKRPQARIRREWLLAGPSMTGVPSRPLLCLPCLEYSGKERSRDVLTVCPRGKERPAAHPLVGSTVVGSFCRREESTAGRKHPEVATGSYQQGTEAFQRRSFPKPMPVTSARTALEHLNLPGGKPNWP
jgi:hypothetical protein